MAELKTKQTTASVSGFLKSVPDPIKRKDAQTILKMLQDITGEKPFMWGPSIVGFGSYHYKYASGHEGDACMIGFSPRKDSLVIYTLSTGREYTSILKALGPHKMSKACLYIKRLGDIDVQILKKLLMLGYKNMKALKKEKGW